MQNEFSILDSFLFRSLPDAEGHAAAPPPEPVLAQMKAFASGALDREQRAALCAELARNPAWIRRLAELLTPRDDDEEAESA